CRTALSDHSSLRRGKRIWVAAAGRTDLLRRRSRMEQRADATPRSSTRKQRSHHKPLPAHELGRGSAGESLQSRNSSLGLCTAIVRRTQAELDFLIGSRSEERRVGKEWCGTWCPSRE